jgi:cob(I)alamin adenosyltransferase
MTICGLRLATGHERRHHPMHAERTCVMARKGLLIVSTGTGKGKTTAALGCMLRAIGHGMRTCLIQFIKGRVSGELKALARFPELAEVHVMGLGFTWTSKRLEKDVAAARKAWAFALKVLREGKHDLVVLDELTYLAKYGIVPERELIVGLSQRAAATTVIVTGRDAGPGLLAAADIATDMNCIRHAFDAGVKARKGIEF